MAWRIVLVGASVGLAAWQIAASARAEERMLRLPEQPYRYASPDLPPHFEPQWVRALDNTPESNPTTDAGAALGRVLFYDTRLSASGTISCGSCHIQQHAFAEPRAVSVGHEGRRGDRNAMSLVNLRFSRAGFFWDERAETLEEAVGLPVRSRIEMAGPGAPAIAKALAADERYAPLFQAAFGGPQITEERIHQALAQFIRSLISSDSKYDRGAAQVASVKAEFPNFTPAENLGKSLFLARCNLCHHIGEGAHVAFFDMFRSLGNGLDRVTAASDGGRGDITFNPTEVGLFKASSLRNVAATAPYMHDGRLATLDEVIEHYSSGVVRHPNAGAVGRFGFSADEKAALVSFLKTLTDQSFLTDPRFSDPWQGSPPAADRENPTTASLNVDAAGDAALPKGSPQLAERLENGKGLLPGEATVWLASLDRDGDGSLSKPELEPLVAIMTKTRIGVLGSGRARREDAAGGAGRRGRREARPAEGDATRLETEPVESRGPGDFDGDGRVSPEETAAYTAFCRLTELGDGGGLRRAVRTDRFLGGFAFSDDAADAARRALNRSRAELEAQRSALDREFLQQLESLIGREALAQFQAGVIDRQVAAVRVRTNRADDPRPIAESQVAQFDEDGDNAWSKDETAALAAALEQLPGGLGAAAPEAIDMEQFVRRFMSFAPDSKGSIPLEKLPERLAEVASLGDRDKSGELSPQELQDFIRSRAFGRLVAEGIYVGGGFANTLIMHADLASELDLPSDKRAAATALITAHEKQLQQLTDESIARQFEAFRTAVGSRVPPTARR